MAMSMCAESSGSAAAICPANVSMASAKRLMPALLRGAMGRSPRFVITEPNPISAATTDRLAVT